MSRVGQEPIAIDYMPWADLKEELTVGPVSFWPFHSKAEEKIPDPEVRTDLARFFEAFVDNADRPIGSIVACSCGPVEFRAFTDEELNSIRAAADCLVFATITSGTKNAVCADNNSMVPPSADRFDLCARWIWPMQGGLVVGTERSLHGWGQGKCRIRPPISVGGQFVGQYEPLLEGLGRAFDHAFPRDVRERLFRSLEWFWFAHTESTAVSWIHKVMMMTTAFEILLEFPERGQTVYFAEQVDRSLRLPDSNLSKRSDGKGNKYEACLAAWWAKDFYDLRSRIAHGSRVTAADLKYKDWMDQLVVADLVLMDLVKRLLYEHHCLGDPLRECSAAAAIEFGGTQDEAEKAWLPTLLGLDLRGVHEALGWVPSRCEEMNEGPNG